MGERKGGRKEAGREGEREGRVDLSQEVRHLNDLGSLSQEVES